MTPATTERSVTLTVPPAPTDDARRAFRAGAVAMTALLVGFVPYGLVVGTAAAASDDPAAGWAGTWLIYSGSAHLAVLGGLSDGRGLLAVVATGLLVNARLLAFSAAIAPELQDERLIFRAVAAALLVDPQWALVQRRPREYAMRAYYLGAGAVLWCGWGAAVTAGLLLGGSPVGAAADVAVPVCLATLAVPHARARPGAACVLVGAFVGLVTRNWPSGVGVLAAMVAGAVAAGLMRRRTA
jgi:predicted branched-subunit amino acid permease